ncbi:PQQ-binding-like beta-propeller repeat protein [Paraburkholderia hospita]|uniref:PQQ-binding-like beta-propeller repeat protein n=1 Tax=Paraburkholderia hospita TaxID=169430 RepID=UPI0008A7AFF6|nr:PQQ-binding-like beta-propeller repeat protein [Paraburkholderia hospita]SEI15227.1 PQQ-like domain-containing protein [Paraburkholderia hospita]
MKARGRKSLICAALITALYVGCSGGGGGDSNSPSTAGGSGSGSGAGPGSGSGSGSPPGSPGSAGATMAQSVDVATYHNDIARTGQQLVEKTLTPANVNTLSFGKIGFYGADGKVDAEPLYLSSVSIAGGTHNVLYVATENDSVYAFDADTGVQLWKVSTLRSGETPSDTLGCFQISPQIGITSTPVIDRTRGPHGVIYVVAMSKDGSGNYFQRIHALDMTTGAELFGGPTTINASYPGNGPNSSGGTLVFNPKQYAERQSLLLLNGNVYTAWTSHCDVAPYNGWVIAYSADTLAQTGVLNVTPNGTGGAIWMSGAGMASDGQSVYFLDANGTFDTTLDASGSPVNGDYGNAFIKLGTSNGLNVTDYFVMANTATESQADEDLGSGGALVLPDLTDASGAVHHLALGAGKDAIIYVVNRDSMGKFNSSVNNLFQQVNGQLVGPEFGMPAYFNGSVYFGSIGDSIKAFGVSGAGLTTAPTSKTPTSYGTPGATPSISANGSANGVVWAVENGDIAVLHAYNAANLATELYNSNQAANARDQFGQGNKFITPMIANGKVYVGTTNGVAVFGLLGGS